MTIDSPSPKIAIVIVNFRTPDLVKGCLDSLAAERDSSPPFKVFVGDAQSDDGSVAAISAHIDAGCMTWATCYDIGKNGGFAFGNNDIVQKYVLPDPTFTHVYFLNPDTYVHPKAMTALFASLQDNPKMGVAGSRLENPDGSHRAYGFRKPAPWREFFRALRFGPLDKMLRTAQLTISPLTVTQRVDWVTGASFMMPRAVLDQVGLMDDKYFLYFEETDLMMRVEAARYEVWHIAESRVVHLAGQSTGVRNKHSQEAEPIARLSPHWLRSRRRFFIKHYGKFGYGLANLLFLMGDCIYRAHRKVRGQPINNPPHMWRDYLYSGATKT